MADTFTLEDLIAMSEDWTPEAKARAFQVYQARISGDRRVWYCKSPGRRCDGNPHEGYDYNHARKDQWPPPGKADWFVWALVGGRGSGKTRGGAEYIRTMSKSVGRIALVGRTNADVRETMVTGESGLEAVFAHAGEKVNYQPALRRVTFPSGCIGSVYSAEEPDRLRGPQHGGAWLDEPAHYDAIDDVWSNLLLGLRLGRDPKIAITTTPLPKKWMKDLLKKSTTKASRVSTYANLNNLAETFAQNVLAMYEGTRLGLQELHGQILEDVEGALWNAEMVHYVETDYLPAMEKIVVAIDPAGTNNRRSDQTGIIVVGWANNALYVLGDFSGKFSPNGWATAAISAYDKFSADSIIVEKNYGGDMVKTTIETALKEDNRTIRIHVRTATRSKKLRAEPIVMLYEQEGRAFHVRGLDDLENEMLTWVPGEGDSPNRIDAMVWGATELSGSNSVASISKAQGRIPSRNPGNLILPGSHRFGSVLPWRQ